MSERGSLKAGREEFSSRSGSECSSYSRVYLVVGRCVAVGTGRVTGDVGYVAGAVAGVGRHNLLFHITSPCPPCLSVVLMKYSLGSQDLVLGRIGNASVPCPHSQHFLFHFMS